MSKPTNELPVHEKDGAHGFLLSKLESWSRQKSLWPVTFGLACCAIEMISTSAARFDIARFGSELFRFDDCVRSRVSEDGACAA